MRVVCNSTPIISLASIQQVELLDLLFDRVYIPRAVYDELRSKRAHGYREVDADPFEVQEIQDARHLGLLLKELDQGEAEAILLAKEMEADFLLIDERVGYQIARAQGIAPIGTLTILLLAKQQKLILAVRPLLDDMIRKGRWYSQSVYTSFLTSIGELNAGDS